MRVWRGVRRAAVLIVVAASVAAACGNDADPLAGREDSSVPASDAGEDGVVPFCDDVPRPGPVTEGDLGSANPDELLMGVLQTYANDHVDTFGGIWIDRAAGAVVLAVTDDPGPHRTAIAELRPSPDDDAVVEPPPVITETTTVAESPTTVDVVQVAHTEAELMSIAEELSARMGADGDDEALGIIGVGVKADINRVTISLRLADTETRAAVGALAPVEALCVEGPAEAPVPIDPDAVDLLAVESDPVVSCHGFRFPLSALDEPADFDESDDPVAAAFREELDVMRVELGPAADGPWRVLDRDDTMVVLGSGDPPSAVVTMNRQGDRWSLGGTMAGEPCGLRRAAPDGVSEATWWLDPAHAAPGPEDTEIHALVMSPDCSGGEPVGDRLIGPQVEVTDDEVVVAFAAVPLPPGAYTCPGNPPTPVLVVLDEPIGDRTIVDGMDLPPRDPVGTEESW